MADLSVRNLEKAEEPGGQRVSFKECLLEMPDPGDDAVFERLDGPMRPVDLETFPRLRSIRPL